MLHNGRPLVAQAQIREVLASERRNESTATLAFELDEMPGAVWRVELESSMPSDMRLTLLERGGHKNAVVTCPVGDEQRGEAAFRDALRGANEVSREAHSAAAHAGAGRPQTAREKQAADPSGDDV